MRTFESGTNRKACREKLLTSHEAQKLKSKESDTCVCMAFSGVLAREGRGWQVDE